MKPLSLHTPKTTSKVSRLAGNADHEEAILLVRPRVLIACVRAVDALLDSEMQLRKISATPLSDGGKSVELSSH